ncbi:MAG: pyridoxal phosphate-dependent aminotransferase [Chitinophagaceae bacterium]|jgi:aspartate aminotransferase|nr:pyridoxal phosphate-dependent aminotransferase [Chitinophagaceae bacterium]
MEVLSHRINRLAESETLQMAKLSRELRSKGFDIIDLSLGEPDFQTPAHICEAAKKAIDEGYTKYPPVAGFLDLRQAISEKFKRENNLTFSPEQIIVSTGAKQSIANVMMVLLDPGDEVILLSPYWVSYREIIKLGEGTMVVVSSTVETNFKTTAEELEKAISPRTKIFCFSSPCNPSGTVYSKEELQSFAEVLARHPGIFVISDEIYEHINFTGKHESIAQFESLKDRVIVVNGCSKAYAMTGWRVGYIGAPLWIAKACDKMQGQITSGTCSIAQRAALTAITADQSETTRMTAEFRKRRDLVLSMLAEIPGIKSNHPEGAFYVFPDVSAFFGKSNGEQLIMNGEDLCNYLIYHAHVTLVTGKAFGDENCIRISYAASEEKLKEALKRMKDALAKLS